MRKYYLDNIRWTIVLLVLVYHVFYLFNGVGVLGGFGGFSKVQYQDAFLYFVYPWFMVLLFLVSGISSRYSLEHRVPRQFIKERTVKLLVPSTLGLFVFQWLTGYFNLIISGAWETIPTAIRYPVMAVSGTGPLWFIQALWLFSLLLVLVKRLDAKDRFYTVCGRFSFPLILSFFLLLWGATQILNIPIVTVYRLGIYFTAFLLGYFVFSHDEVQAKVRAAHLPLFFVALAMGVAYTVFYFGQNYAGDACLKSLFTNIYTWVAILAVLGCGQAWFDRTSRFANYMAKSSFGIYIVHYLVVLSVCYFLKFYTFLPVPMIYLTAIISVLGLSPLLYELLKRIPVLKYLVLGISDKKKD